MKTRDDKVKRILKLTRTSGIMSTGEVSSLGIHHEYLRQLCEEGKLVRIGRGRKCAIDEMWRYAKVCRVTKIMRPYMEAIV